MRFFRRACAAVSVTWALWSGGAAAQSFNPVTFGVNLDMSLLNPLDGTSGEAPLRQQVALAMHDTRAIGATTVRWFVSDVWPQWRCGTDPEDQTTGEIDPGWFTTARVLLQGAQDNHIKVVVVFTDLADGSTGFNGVTVRDTAKRDATLAQWATHRRQQPGGYASAACPAQPGYYGATQPAQLFTQPDIRAHLLRRDVAMARFLAQYPALGAIELFNEPPYTLTTTPEFWTTVGQLRAAIRAASPATPISSGVVWWSADVTKQATAQGVLQDEPYITLHSYQDYSGNADHAARAVQTSIDATRRLVPGKPLVIAEAASSTSLPTLAENQDMVRSLLKTYLDADVGVWVWGDWFTRPDSHDYEWTFNDRSPVGDSFRPYGFNAQQETAYRQPQAVHLTSGVTPVAIGRVAADDPNPDLRGLFFVNIGDTKLVGFSRAGVFPQPFAQQPSRFAAPPNTYFLTQPGEALHWAQVAYRDGTWELSLFACATEEGGTPTPDIIFALAGTRDRSDFAACRTSSLVAKGQL